MASVAVSSTNSAVEPAANSVRPIAPAPAAASRSYVPIRPAVRPLLPKAVSDFSANTGAPCVVLKRNRKLTRSSGPSLSQRLKMHHQASSTSPNSTQASTMSAAAHRTISKSRTTVAPLSGSATGGVATGSVPGSQFAAHPSHKHTHTSNSGAATVSPASLMAKSVGPSMADFGSAVLPPSPPGSISSINSTASMRLSSVPNLGSPESSSMVSELSSPIEMASPSELMLPSLSESSLTNSLVESLSEPLVGPLDLDPLGAVEQGTAPNVGDNELVMPHSFAFKMFEASLQDTSAEKWSSSVNDALNSLELPVVADLDKDVFDPLDFFRPTADIC